MAAQSRATRIGGRLFKRIAKPIPIVGTVVVLATAYVVLRRKGLLRGGLDVALDATPVVGTVKGAVELITGDLIPDRTAARPARKGSEFRNSQGSYEVEHS